MYNVKRNSDGSVNITEVGGKEPLYTLGAETILAFKQPGSDLEVKPVKEFGDDTALIRALMFKCLPL